MYKIYIKSPEIEKILDSLIKEHHVVVDNRPLVRNVSRALKVLRVNGFFGVYLDRKTHKTILVLEKLPTFYFMKTPNHRRICYQMDNLGNNSQ